MRGSSILTVGLADNKWQSRAVCGGLSDQMHTPTTSVGKFEMARYWDQARRPFSGLVFLLPMLVVYEVGVAWLGQVWPGEVRNLADLWIRGGLAQLGLDHWLALPVLVGLGLLVWHKAARHPWGVRGRTLVGMLAESIVFAVGLFLLARLQWWAHGHWSLAISPGETVVAARLVSYVGAGVYEEVLFRLCLLPCCWTVLRGLGYRRWVAMAGAVVVTSLFFAAAHHLGTTGEAFGWFAFSFRTLAGLVFGGLFVARGFGITVGAHVAYDLLIGVMFVTA
mgnify:CR=1 FL=1